MDFVLVYTAAQWWELGILTTDAENDRGSLHAVLAASYVFDAHRHPRGPAIECHHGLHFAIDDVPLENDLGIARIVQQKIVPPSVSALLGHERFEGAGGAARRPIGVDLLELAIPPHKLRGGRASNVIAAVVLSADGYLVAAVRAIETQSVRCASVGRHCFCEVHAAPPALQLVVRAAPRATPPGARRTRRVLAQFPEFLRALARGAPDGEFLFRRVVFQGPCMGQYLPHLAERDAVCLAHRVLRGQEHATIPEPPLARHVDGHGHRVGHSTKVWPCDFPPIHVLVHAVPEHEHELVALQGQFNAIAPTQLHLELPRR
mmetsp:Transcript_18434/g.50603  ORF Transcript_18434/g.50603 Transcript_18434/m.50603 type:complete len:318 (-) Transcript_18434:735-1688(-)